METVLSIIGIVLLTVLILSGIVYMIRCGVREAQRKQAVFESKFFHPSNHRPRRD